MRRWLALACRAFPLDHRARHSDEFVDTALLAADGSAWRGFREGCSLGVAGLRARLRAEPSRSIGDGLALLAGVLALVNLSVAFAGIALAVYRPPLFTVFSPPIGFRGAPWTSPYRADWWWIGFAVAAGACVLGLVLGSRRLALVAALANAGIVAYDATVLAPHDRGHLNAIAYLQGNGGYPVGREWLGPAVLLALVTAVTPLRRLSLARLPLAFAASVVLVALSRERFGFFYLRWPVAAIVVLALAVGWFAPRLAVLGVGLSLAVAAPVIEYVTAPSWAYHDPVVTWVVAPALALGVTLPLGYLARRRLT